MQKSNNQSGAVKLLSWKKLDNLSYSSKYKYPGANLPRYNLKEGRALQLMLPQKCKGIFLDYGCGEGVMFRYIKKHYKRLPPLIIGVEPDTARLNTAKKILSREGGSGIFLNTTFDNSIFRKESLQNSISCSICIQVFGHISEYKFMNALKTIHHLLKPHGLLIIAVPFVNSEFNFPKWQNGKDFFCLNNCLLNKLNPKRKSILSEKRFTYLLNNPIPNYLPIRRFFVNEKAKYGNKCNKHTIVSSRLGKIITGFGFGIKKAIVYKVKAEKGSGDLMLSFSPNK